MIKNIVGALLISTTAFLSGYWYGAFDRNLNIGIASSQTKMNAYAHSLSLYRVYSSDEPRSEFFMKDLESQLLEEIFSEMDMYVTMDSMRQRRDTNDLSIFKSFSAWVHGGLDSDFLVDDTDFLVKGVMREFPPKSNERQSLYNSYLESRSEK